jgi:O-antigen/teichoic acid export membrane protein
MYENFKLILINRITSLKENERTLKAINNIINSFAIKGLSIVISFILVPLSIKYLGNTKYGIWITLGSIINWFSYFDIGLGNGLRNKFATAKSEGNNILARKYVSTTYAILSIIMICLMVIFIVINPFLDWNKLLNAGNTFHSNELQILSYIIFILFCLNFILKLITTILTADQKPAKASIFDLYSRVIAVVSIYFLTNIDINSSSIVIIGVIITGSQTIVLLIANFKYFNNEYKEFSPNLKLVDFSYGKELFNLGLKFFIIQLSSLLLYQTNIVIISQQLGPEIVTKYNIGFSYYGSLSMIFAIIISPFWSAFTEAWVKKDIGWIKNIMRNLIKSWVGLLIIGLLMVVFSKAILKLWIGNDIEITYKLSFIILAYFMISAWNGIYSTLLNGIGKVKLQLYIGVITALLNIPLSIFLGTYIGLEGILIANIIIAIPGLIIYPIQYKKLINGKKDGIWVA